MRLKNLIKGDIHFQIKYGFYFIYAVLTIFYVILLFSLPEAWRENAASIMIFSDPAAMGLFFMGAIVLLEKSQRVLNALAVSPVKVVEYIFSKVVSLCLISVIVALIIAFSANMENLFMVLFGTTLTSIIFTLLGLIMATKIHSLNQFLIVTMPIEIICFGPALASLFGYCPAIMKFYPINLCMGLVAGKSSNSVIDTSVVIITIAVLAIITYISTKKMWRSVGGVKL